MIQAQDTQVRCPVRELRTLGSVRGALSNGRLYRDWFGIATKQFNAAVGRNVSLDKQYGIPIKLALLR